MDFFENVARSGGACEDNEMIWLHFNMLINKMLKLTVFASDELKISDNC